MRTRIVWAYERLLTACGFVAGATLAALALLITLDVLVRNLGLFSSGALLEITEYALFASTFLAAPWVLWAGSHVRVDLVLTQVPAPVARLMEIAADTAGLVCSALLGWHGFNVTLVSFQRGDLIVKQLVVPEWMLMMFIPASCLLLVIEFSRRIVATWRSPPLTHTVSRPREGF
jgi:TRAP-type C4-dicarboxylate transport system permease small subunit